MKLRSHALLFKDFDSAWYTYWAKELKQDKAHLDGFALRSNKFWQNAAICQALADRGALFRGSHGIGFGVGQERLPAVFAKRGVNVTATDQDFRKQKAQAWSEAELAIGLESLNRAGITSDKTIQEHISYQPLDMTTIPKRFYEVYDFAWSNCALGHLGSIEKGLLFIEDSLKCLKPGGVAAHTTEVNILSNDATVDSGGTVIFRLKDIYTLMQRLTAQGYICSPLRLNLGGSSDDNRISMRPTFGNDFSKIQYEGHLLTQVILIIQKPKRPLAAITRVWQSVLLAVIYRKSLIQLHRFKHGNTELTQHTAPLAAPPETIRLAPTKNKIKVTIASPGRKQVYIEYRNESSINLYAVRGHLAGVAPLILATSDPHDRQSPFANETWVNFEQNRPSSDLYIKERNGNYVRADYVKPGKDFAFLVTFDARAAKPGVYQEGFCVVQEGSQWIAGSEVMVEVRVS
jgi:hypothetical protein